MEIIIDNIRGEEIEQIISMGGKYEGLKTSYGEGVFQIKNKSLSIIKKLFEGRIKSER